MSDGSYLDPKKESDWDRTRNTKSFKPQYLKDSGWYTVVNDQDGEIDASGDGGLTEYDAGFIADALNFYIKAQLLNGSRD